MAANINRLTAAANTAFSVVKRFTKTSVNNKINETFINAPTKQSPTEKNEAIFAPLKLLANNFNGAKIASFFSVGLCLVGALINVSLILLFTDVLVNLFTTEKAVFAAAVNLLIFAAIFQLPDGIQMGALGSFQVHPSGSHQAIEIWQQISIG